MGSDLLERRVRLPDFAAGIVLCVAAITCNRDDFQLSIVYSDDVGNNSVGNTERRSTVVGSHLRSPADEPGAELAAFRDAVHRNAGAESGLRESVLYRDFNFDRPIVLDPPLAAAGDLQIGSYQLDSSTFRATGTSTPTPRRIRYALSSSALSALTNFAPGALIEARYCPHRENNVVQSGVGYYGEPGPVFPRIAAISTTGSLWVEVEKPDGSFPVAAPGETCQVTLSNTIFRTARLNTYIAGDPTASPPVPDRGQSVGLRWYNYNAGQIRIWRRHMELIGRARAWVAVTTAVALGEGYQEYFDDSAAPDRKNCYQLETLGVGFSTVHCVYTQSREGPITRVQLALTTWSNQRYDPPEPRNIVIRVRLQRDPKLEDFIVPNGHVSYLDSTIPDFMIGQTQSYDLTTNNIRQLSDITDIYVEQTFQWGEAPVSNPCFSHLTLVVDNDRNLYRIAFDKAIWPCQRQIHIPFEELRNSPEWRYQVDRYYDSQIHFRGYDDPNDFKAYIMAEFATRLYDEHSNLQDTPLEITKGINDNLVHIRAHTNSVVGVVIDFDLEIRNTYGCVDDVNARIPGVYGEITDTQIGIVESSINARASNSFVTIGAALLKEITTSAIDIQRSIQEKTVKALKNVTSRLSPDARIQYVFTPRGTASSAAGFGFKFGQDPPPLSLRCPPPP